MESVKFGAVALVCLIMLLVLRSWRPEWAPLLRLAAAVVFGGALMGTVGTVITTLRGWSEHMVSDAVWSLLVKTLGLAIITEMAAGICRDSGEASLAAWVETAGKIEILLLTLPLAEEVLTVAKDLMGVG